MQYESEHQINQVEIWKVQMLGSHKFGTPKAGRGFKTSSDSKHQTKKTGELTCKSKFVCFHSEKPESTVCNIILVPKTVQDFFVVVISGAFYHICKVSRLLDFNILWPVADSRCHQLSNIAIGLTGLYAILKQRNRTFLSNF